MSIISAKICLSIVNILSFCCRYLDNKMSIDYHNIVMNRLRTAKHVQVISALVEGVSINTTCRMEGVAKHTVLNLLRDLGCAADKCILKLENHGHAVAPYFLHYNFCRIHKTLQVTPAMEAGIADHVWSMDELVALLDVRTIQRAA